MDTIELDYEEFLRCPITGSSLHLFGHYLRSQEARLYPVVHGVPVMLAPRTASTLWVADASLLAAQNNPDGTYHVDTLGVTEDQARMLKLRLGSEQLDAEPSDPVISYLIQATSGHMYDHLVGRLTNIPIPEIRLPVPSAGALLLDLGCSWGRWSISAARLGYRVIGIDPSLGAILAAKRLATKLGLDDRIRFLVGDALQLPFAPRIFDAVFSYSVLQHFSVENTKAALKQARHVSKEKAQLMVQMPNRYGVRCIYHQAKRLFRSPHGFEVRYYSPRCLINIFTECYGLAALSVDGFFGLGIQPSDAGLMTKHKKLVIHSSEFLRGVSHHVKPLIWAADSVFVSAVRS